MANRRGMQVPLVLPTGSTIGKSGQAANARLVNAYAEPSGEDGKSAFTIYGAPGLRRWDSGSFAGPCRGLIKLSESSLIAILGNEVVSFSSTGVGTPVGALVGSKRVHLSRNRANPPQITMSTESLQAFVLQSGVVTPVSDPDLPPPVSHCYLSGFTIYGILDGRIFASDLENSSSISASAFGDSKADDSRLVKVLPDSNYLYVLNKAGTEVWRPNANAPNPNFLFSPTQQNTNIGCGAAFSVVSVPNRGIVWMDNEGIIRLGQGAGAQRISTHTVERDIADLSSQQRADIYIFYYSFEGHEMLQVVSERWTWEYALTYGRWFQRKAYARPRYLIQYHEVFADLHIVGNDRDGKLYYIDPKAYSDDGDPHIMEIWCAHSHRFPGSMIVDAVELDVIRGVGENTGVPADDDPHLMLDYSDDGGATFQGQRELALGKIGERRRKLSSRQWGRVDNAGRIWRIRASANVLKGVNQVSLFGRPCSNG